MNHRMRILIFTVVLLKNSVASAVAPAERCPIMFFDLGQALIDTATNNYNPMFYLKPGPGFADNSRFPSGKEYIDLLTQRYGLSLGLLIDVPVDWGTPQDPPFEPINDPLTSKFLRTQEFLLGLHPADESSFTGIPFDWSPFGDLSGKGADRVLTGRIFLPSTEAERKLSKSLFLFQRGMEVSTGCPVIYQSSIEDEMRLAQKAGMIPFWVGHTSRTFYLPPERIDAYIQFARTPRPSGSPEFWRGPF